MNIITLVILILLILLAAAVLIPSLLPARVISRIPLPARLLAGIGALAVAAFCGFGFLATFEPLDPAEQWTWRIIYSLGALAAIGGSLRLFLSKTDPGPSHS